MLGQVDASCCDSRWLCLPVQVNSCVLENWILESEDVKVVLLFVSSLPKPAEWACEKGRIIFRFVKLVNSVFRTKARNLFRRRRRLVLVWQRVLAIEWSRIFHQQSRVNENCVYLAIYWDYRFCHFVVDEGGLVVCESRISWLDFLCHFPSTTFVLAARTFLHFLRLKNNKKEFQEHILQQRNQTYRRLS